MIQFQDQKTASKLDSAVILLGLFWGALKECFPRPQLIGPKIQEGLTLFAKSRNKDLGLLCNNQPTFQ